MITIEFLIGFSATVVMVYILSAALLAAHSEIQQTVFDYQKISRAKQAARIVETWLYDGRMSDLAFEDLYFKLENSLIVDHPEGVIEIEGVFLNDNKQPI